MTFEVPKFILKRTYANVLHLPTGQQVIFITLHFSSHMYIILIFQSVCINKSIEFTAVEKYRYICPQSRHLFVADSVTGIRAAGLLGAIFQAVNWEWNLCAIHHLFTLFLIDTVDHSLTRKGDK